MPRIDGTSQTGRFSNLHGVPDANVVTVLTGERTLADVARRLGMGEQALLSANPQIRNVHDLKPGQEIHFPTARQSVKSDASETFQEPSPGESNRTSGSRGQRSLEGQLRRLRLEGFIGSPLPSVVLAQLRHNAKSTGVNTAFSADTAQKVAEKYKSDDVRPMHGDNARGGCMNAVYEGLGQLYTPEYSDKLRKRVFRDSKRLEERVNQRREAQGRDPVPERAFNTIDRVWETLRKDGKAGDPLKFKHKNNKWDPLIETTVLDTVKDNPNGWYFFGVSASGASHSAMVAVDKTQSPAKLYWLDQSSEGFDARSSSYATNTTDVTGKLDKTVSNVGTNETQMWPLIPDANP
jgi:LysM domain